MLLEPAPTQYDLNFQIGRTPVRVHIGFWIFSAILGWQNVNNPNHNGLVLLGIWVLSVFASILLHEFGHVLAGEIFGSHGYIVLYSFGGLAVGSNSLRIRWQRIVVSLAGPGIQLALYGLMWLALNYVIMDRIYEWHWTARAAYFMMMDINWIWPLFNLLPVWPLDGGMVTRELCEAASWRDGTRNSLIISIVAAAFIAINTLLAINGRDHVPYLFAGGNYGVILFLILGVESYQLLQHINNRPRFDDRTPWDSR